VRPIPCSSIAARTAVLSCGLALLFIGGVFVAKKLAARPVRKLIQTWKDMRETEELVAELAVA